MAELNDKVEKREKVPVKEGEALPDPSKDKAVGPLLGGRVIAKAGLRPKATPVKGTRTGEVPTVRHTVTGISEVYGDGLTFLAVKCTRGEQKALSGDVAYQITLTDEETLEETVYLFLVPGECVQHLADLVPPVADTEGMTVAEWDAFQKEEADKDSRRRSPVKDRGRVPPPAAQLPASTK